MNGKGLFFKRIDVKRMPGCSGFTLNDLVCGVNIIHGPNASGKSTTARAIRSLLWTKLAPEGAELNATFDYDENHWDVTHDDRKTIYRVNVTEATSPINIDQSRCSAYFLELSDLLSSDSQNFAEEIRRELIGGYDINSAALNLGYAKSPERLRNCKDALEEREKAVTTANELQMDLQEDEDRLDQLRHRLEEAEAAQKQVSIFENALLHAKTREDYNKAKEAHHSFDSRFSRILGNEQQILDDLARRQNEITARKIRARRSIDESRDNAKKCRFAACITPDGLSQSIRSLYGYTQELQDFEKRRDDKATEIENAIGECKTARRNIRQITGFDALDDELAAITIPENWTQMSEFVRETENLRGKMLAQEQLKNWFASRNTEDSEIDTEPLRQKISKLQEWLEAGAESGSKRLIHRKWFRWAAGIALILTAAFSLITNSHLILVIPAVIGLVLLTSQENDSAYARLNVQNRYVNRWDDAPSIWTTDSVSELLRELWLQLGKQNEKNEEIVRAREITKADDDLSQRQIELQNVRIALANRIGIAPQINDNALCLLTDGIHGWQLMYVKLQGCREAFKDLNARCVKFLETINQVLTGFGYQPSTNSGLARANIDDLSFRFDQYKMSLNSKQGAVRELINARKDIVNIEKERDDVFSRLGFMRDEENVLRELISKIDDYRIAKTALDKSKGAMDSSKKLLVNKPELLDLNEYEVSNMLNDSRQIASGRDDIHRQIVEIDTKIASAKQGHILEEALMQREKKREELRKKREEAYHSAAGSVLSEFLKTSSQTETIPVFTEANRKFAEFTYHQFTLEFDNNDKSPVFAARETSTNELRSLNELSSGTRVQLLLAVRMAFAEWQEVGIKLPIILDETLATSDDERVRKIIEAVIEICSNGRQAFYFTAQTDEVRKWMNLLNDHNSAAGNTKIDFTCVDLVETRNLEMESLPFPEFEMDDCQIPAPDNLSHYEYGKLLGVPRCDMRSTNIGTIHIWHLIEDTHLIYSLMQNERVTTWGQLQSMYKTRMHKPIDDTQFTRISATARVLEEISRCWYIGRGRPITIQTIDASGAVSETYRERVLSLLKECDGDAENLLQSVSSLKGFRHDRMLSLTNYLREEGYLDERPKLQKDEIISRVLNEMHMDIQMGSITAENVLRMLDKSLADTK